MERNIKECLIKLAEGLQKERKFEVANPVKHPFSLTNSFAVILRLRDLSSSNAEVKVPDYNTLE